jgi:hypothetical protein
LPAALGEHIKNKLGRCLLRVLAPLGEGSMKERILACFLLLSGCEDRPTEIANFATTDNSDAIGTTGASR